MKDPKMQVAKKKVILGGFFEKSHNDDFNLCITCMSSQKLLILASKTYPIYFGNQVIVVSGYICTTLQAPIMNHLWKDLHVECNPANKLPTSKLPYIPSKNTFEDDVPFPRVGYVSSLEGYDSMFFFDEYDSVLHPPIFESILSDTYL